mmetsp:Transcript_13879/g.31513  ORF Transcript_13879/g.31513 Transcript_13879/m.31513 type:complete len:277 (+) Transcript_13879:465-1295(+)
METPLHVSRVGAAAEGRATADLCQRPLEVGAHFRAWAHFVDRLEGCRRPSVVVPLRLILLLDAFVPGVARLHLLEHRGARCSALLPAGLTAVLIGLAVPRGPLAVRNQAVALAVRDHGAARLAAEAAGLAVPGRLEAVVPATCGWPVFGASPFGGNVPAGEAAVTRLAIESRLSTSGLLADGPTASTVGCGALPLGEPVLAVGCGDLSPCEPIFAVGCGALSPCEPVFAFHRAVLVGRAVGAQFVAPLAGVLLRLDRLAFIAAHGIPCRELGGLPL